MKKIHMLLILAAMASFVAVDVANGYAKASREMMIKGPWEIVIKVGNQKGDISFPVSVEDETLGQKMNKPLPIMKTPVKVKLIEYVPDLQWRTLAQEDENGESLALLLIKGPALDQQIWLDSSDDQKKTINAKGIGSVALKHLYSQKIVTDIKEKLKTKNTTMALALWLEDSAEPLEYAVDIDETVELPESKYSFKVLRYIPHYMIDMDTKEVTTASEVPLNPAIEIEVTDGKDTFKQWLWSKFDSPHMENKLPFKVVFNDFDLREPGNYVIASTPQASTEIFFLEDEKIVSKTVTPEEKFIFANAEYSFNVIQLHHTAVLKDEMLKESGKLLNPAIIAMIEYADTKSQAVLELNKPYSYASVSGSMVLLFKKDMSSHMLAP